MDTLRENEPLLPSNSAGNNHNARNTARRAKIRKALPYGLVTLVLFVVAVVLLVLLVEPHKGIKSQTPAVCTTQSLLRLSIFPSNTLHHVIMNLMVVYPSFNVAVEEPVDTPIDSPFSGYLRTPAIFSHLEQLYDVALKHNNSRSFTNGYLASAEYVQMQLKANAAEFCEVSTQEFRVPVWKELEEPKLFSVGIGGEQVEVEYQNKVDFQNFRYNGPSTTLKNQAIQGVANHGCSAKDHKNLTGKIAVIEEGSENCDLWTAAYHSRKAGATGVLFFNSATRKELRYSEIRIDAWKEGDPLISIPVLSITNSLGSILLQNQHSTTLTLTTKNSQTVESTINVLCTTKHGQANDTIVIGAHLDSVPEGPGIVDNGSGSSAILEIVLTLAKNIDASSLEIKNKVVFAWWGAEEIGLLGARHYVRDLAGQGDDAKREVSLNLNFDMLASPNYVPYIHDGSSAPDSLIVPSTKLDHLLGEYFELHKKDFEYADMGRGSDYLPFLDEGIPAGGLMTGASRKKSMEQRKRFGGFANAQLDPCYHQSCDTLDNVSKEALELMSQAALHAITKLATSKNLRDWLSNGSAQIL
ncbi:Leucyl aminopeptidase yscIV [Mortierella alpina]|nr:Leucyl aminopeptidase yscIV [Mortierella alpina]